MQARIRPAPELLTLAQCDPLPESPCSRLVCSSRSVVSRSGAGAAATAPGDCLG